MERKNKTTGWTSVSEIEITYKSKIKAADRPQVKHSSDCYQLFLQTWDDGKLDLIEQFKMMLLNRNNRVLGILEISTGGMTTTVVDPKIIFGAALKAAACAIVLCHSHPSGSLRPSASDEQLTAELSKAAKYIDIRMLDHIILTRDNYFSFADNGML